MRHRAAFGLLATSACVAIAAIAHAGPLNPPDGPVSSTHKTLTEVEPRILINATNTPGGLSSMYRISSPGSYYMSENFAVYPSKWGIEVAADNVTIDMNGMTITGTPTSIGGIVAAGVYNNLTIRNGTIKSIGAGNGVGYTVAGGRGWKIENITSLSNGSDGVRAPGASIVRNCRAASNGSAGIRVADASMVIECIAESNTSVGISLATAAQVLHTVARANQNDGISGMAQGVQVIDCISTGNTGNGITTMNGGRVTGCDVSSNTAVGIAPGYGSTVASNTITSCNDGIWCVGQTYVHDNTCTYNGESSSGSGIYATGNENRIDNNVCNVNGIGIRVSGSLNMITRNTVGSNAALNWSVSAGNRCLVIQTAGGVAISGNSGGTAPGSTDPNANYTN